MRIFVFISIIFLRLSTIGFTQENLQSIEVLEKNFRTFQYEQVISISGQMLTQKERFSQAELIEIYRMRAISFYSAGKLNLSLGDFLTILKIKPAFNLDPVKTSPKILNFFNSIKANFQAIIPPDSKADLPDTTQLKHTPGDKKANIPGQVIRSLIIPGWGHQEAGLSKKGRLLGGTSLVTMSLAGYFIFDTYKNEKAYLNEVDKSQIETKYQAYNTAYKTRNVLLLSYGLIWLYSQVDLLFFNHKDLKTPAATKIFPHFSTEKLALVMTIRF